MQPLMLFFILSVFCSLHSNALDQRAFWRFWEFAMIYEERSAAPNTAQESLRIPKIFIKRGKPPTSITLHRAEGTKWYIFPDGTDDGSGKAEIGHANVFRYSATNQSDHGRSAAVGKSHTTREREREYVSLDKVGWGYVNDPTIWHWVAIVTLLLLSI